MNNTALHVDDHVTLTQALGPCDQGDEGKVVAVHSDGNVTVKITHKNPGCQPFVFLLPPATPDHFSPGGVCDQ